jgi:hypothetical protein
MNTILDILGASIIGLVITLIILNLNIYSNQVKYTSDSNLTLQGNAKTLAEIIDYDLRKIGYNYKGVAIQTAQSNIISFYSDIDSSGTAKLVTLTMGDSIKATSTPNPHDKFFYYIINNDTTTASLGLTNLKFSYMDSLGNATSVLKSIKYIKTETWLESPDKMGSDYEKTYWEITVSPRNL